MNVLTSYFLVSTPHALFSEQFSWGYVCLAHTANQPVNHQRKKKEGLCST